MNLYKVKHISISVLLLFFIASSVFGLDVPELKGRVNDYGNILSSSTEQQLDALLRDLERTDSTQIVVLTIPSLEGDSLEDFSIRVAEKWKIGQEGKDNGAILLISKNDRKLRIEVGYGLEGSLTDLISGRIIRDVIVPQFKGGNFDAGVSNGVQAMIMAVRGEYKGGGKPVRVSSRPSSGNSKFFAIMVIIFLVNMVGRLRRPLGAVAGGVLFPILGALFFNLGFLMFIALIPIGIFGGLFLSLFGSPLTFGSLHNRRGGRFWTSGGGFGGFSGGGFGGFSGGGGGFGGGGASGGW